ncbi:MAG: hypothetical protein AAF726_20760 [Planctomycetota bacterium]
MPFATPGPLRDETRCARYQAREGALEPESSGAGARGIEQSAKPATEAEVLGFGMKLFLASLSMIFGATFVAYGIIWWKNRSDWQGAVDTGEVFGLAAATVLLVVADVAAMRAFKRVADRSRAARLTLFTVIAASVYMIVQSIAWFPLLAQADSSGDGTLRMEGFLFLMLTFAHAVHVLGGIFANVIVLARSSNGRGPTRGALQLLYQYWRFLTVVWIFVLALLFAF